MKQNLAARRDIYASAAPFPHIVLDAFLPASQYAELIARFPTPDADIWLKYKTGRENRKLQSRSLEDMPEAVAEAVRHLNSDAFVKTLEGLTGIHGLVADPGLTGGGMHQTLRGGHLGMHIDYNRHRESGLARRLNVILYLNDEWRDDWGGHLELWDRDMRNRVQRIAPIGNRLVVFSTSEQSWHGHPEPLACPDGVTRKSIALYFYGPDASTAADHNTVFRERPGERFKVTARERIGALVRSVVPRHAPVPFMTTKLSTTASLSAPALTLRNEIRHEPTATESTVSV